MLTVSEENYSSEESFAQILQVLKKTEAVEIARLTNLKVPSALKKYDYICHLAKVLEYGAYIWKGYLPKNEVELLKKILDCPKGEGVTMYMPQHGIMLCKMCILVGKKEAEEDLYTLYLITEQLRESLREAIEHKEKGIMDDGEDKQWEKIGLGLLNYFGFMLLDEFKTQMKRRTKIEDEYRFIYWMYSNMLFNQSFVTFVDDVSNEITCLCSPMLEDIGALCRERSLRPDLEPDYDKPTNEQLMAYGTLPFMAPYSNTDKAMYDYLVKEQKMSKEKADWVFSELWRREQISKKPTDVITWLNKIGVFTSLEQINRMVDVNMRFSNNMPKWTLCGHSSEELFKKSQKPKLQPQPQMPQMPQMPVMAMGGKVGRNDPCPCGSGKKYKNCCGK